MRRHPFVPRIGTPQQFKDRQTAYKLCFGSPAGQVVLRDLMAFCRFAETCYASDARDHALLEGRREVVLRIVDHMRLPSDQAYELFGGKMLKPEEIEDARSDPDA